MTDTTQIALPTGEIFPVIPLRDFVVFPHIIAPVIAARSKSVKALQAAAEADRPIILVTQRSPTTDEIGAQDLYEVGTVANILQLVSLPDGAVKALIEGQQRARIVRFLPQEDSLTVQAQLLPELPCEDMRSVKIMSRIALSQFEQYLKVSSRLTPDLYALVSRIEDPYKLADSIASHLNCGLAEKQAVLETMDLNARLEKICALLEAEIDVLQAERRVRRRVKKQVEKTQREYYLNEQIKAIQKELGDGDDASSEADALEERVKKTKLSKEALDKAQKEIRKLRNMSPTSAEATVSRNYLEWLLDVPWKKTSKVKKDLEEAHAILDRDHYGLEKVKERIVEYLAVQKRVGKVRGPILCLMGPPGVGKTSLGRSIAEATGRQFVRVALGGVRDEADIRGHRRTYIGSMPGKILQGMKKAGTSNPLFLLDEIDKMSADYRGDPSSALLEVLDPEQNTHFNDHYLEVDYDLSDVLFVTTSNSLNMPAPLRDRLEIIHLSGYTEDEKVEIAKRHLIPKQMEEHGLKPDELTVDEPVLYDLVRYYTREAGVRHLEREIARLARKVVTQIVVKKQKNAVITSENLADYAGVRRFDYGHAEKKNAVGMTTGLAWTEVGGELLTIEAVLLPGKGKITTTGKLGEVMQESVQAAASYVRARGGDFGIKLGFFEKHDIHIHVPEGAIPKDGPSAGIAMLTSIVSVLTGIAIRKDVAMTGEITLRGFVLPIGGLKEKLLAAHRGGIKKVLIPKGNEKDLVEIPENIKSGLKIILVETADQVLQHALTHKTHAILWQDETGIPIMATGLKAEKMFTINS